MTELEVPRKAADEMTAVVIGLRDDLGVDENIRAIATPVVVAELRRLASILDSGHEALDGEDEAYGAGKADAADLLRNAAKRYGGAS